MTLIFIQLFVTFLVIGLFTFGGGYAMLSLIQGQVVSEHGWLTESTFTDIVAISQITPGPVGINCATYVGYDVIVKAGGSHLLGVLGSFTSTTAVVLPSFLIVLALVRFYMKINGNPLFDSVMYWLRPAVVGLIGSAAIVLTFRLEWNGVPLFSSFEAGIVSENFLDWKSWLLFAGALAVSLCTKTGPIPLIITGGILGLILY